jgi:hypothetical protein
MASRRPVLVVGPPGPASEFLTQAGAGIAVGAEDVRQLGAGIVRAASMARDPSFVGPSEGVLNRFARTTLAREWAAVLGNAGKDALESRPINAP